MNIYNCDYYDKLVLDNTRLVHYLMKKIKIYDVGGYDYDDIYQIGIIGLIKAAKTYDKSVKFVTYASKCIYNEIYMFFRNSKKYIGYISLDEPISFDNHENTDVTYGDLIESSNSNFVDRIIDLDLIEKALNIILNVFSVRDKLILIYYILHKNQQYISKKFEISQSYVSRLQSKLIKELNNYMGHPINYEEVYHMCVNEKNCSVSFVTNDINTFNKVILDVFKQNYNIWWYKISRKGDQIIIKFLNIEEALDIIASLIDKIDTYSMILKKENRLEDKNSADKNFLDKENAEESQEKLKTPPDIIRKYFLNKSEFTFVELLNKFPEYPRNQIQSVINYSKLKGQIKSIKRGVYRVIKE